MPDFTLETFFIDLWLYSTMTTIACLSFYKYRLCRNDKLLLINKIKRYIEEKTKGR